MDFVVNSAFITFAGLAPPGGWDAVPPSVVRNATRPYSSRPLPQWPAEGPMSSWLNGLPAILRISLRFLLGSSARRSIVFSGWLARYPTIQIETVKVGFFPRIYIRDRNVEDIGFNFDNAHCGLWKCEEKLGLYRLLMVRNWN